LWPPILPIVLAAGALIWFTLGIASITTMAIGLVVTVVFAIYASLGVLEPVNIWYGVIAELLLMWALRPNIKKLLSGKERVVKFSLNGWLRAKREAQAQTNK
jgi:glycerol-3-phosphate acyltransferase PlsY